MDMPLEERLGHDVKRVEQELMAVKGAAVKPSGLTVPQYAALLVLSDHPGMSAAELARRCLVTAQTMATVLKNLEANGLIERHPHPYHRNLLETSLTAEGAEALGKADERAVGIERRMAEEFTAEERESLREMLARCSRILREEAASHEGAQDAIAAVSGPRK